MKHHSFYLLVLAATFSCIQSSDLKPSDIAEIKELEKGYVDGWFAENQQEAVLKVFDEDVAFIPHHGDDPVIGKENLREFFWPDGIGGIVHSFNHYPDAIEGNNGVAWIRGRFDVKYSWIDQGDTTTTFNEGNYVLIARKKEQEWKIATFIFNDPLAE
ncbi:hypothetical protein [Ekhidna sp. To15]|uniref:hypothetical protein n=1 Tax=Ekhidna sp. To15 TaxID=3395267 RepID=UPI003F528F72